jgi:hypothetical protein
MKMPTVYLAACDDYLHALKATQFLFKEFWPTAKVVVLGYKKPDFEFIDNWSFVSMGDDPGVAKWSNGLIEYFNSIDDEYFIFNVEDCPPIKPVRVDIIEKMLPLLEDKNIGKITLTEDISNRAFDFHSILDGTQIIKTSQVAAYRLSTQYAIWKKEYLLKYLKPNMNAWEFEVNGSALAENDGYDILGTFGQPEQDYAIHSCEAIRKRNVDTPLQFFNPTCKSYRMELDQYYINEMKSNGIL